MQLLRIEINFIGITLDLQFLLFRFLLCCVWEARENEENGNWCGKYRIILNFGEGEDGKFDLSGIFLIFHLLAS